MRLVPYCDFCQGIKTNEPFTPSNTTLHGGICASCVLEIYEAMKLGDLSKQPAPATANWPHGSMGEYI